MLKNIFVTLNRLWYCKFNI